MTRILFRLLVFVLFLLQLISSADLRRCCPTTPDGFYDRLSGPAWCRNGREVILQIVNGGGDWKSYYIDGPRMLNSLNALEMSIPGRHVVVPFRDWRLVDRVFVDILVGQNAVKTLEFSPASNHLDFFSASHLISSSWLDLQPSSFKGNYFSVTSGGDRMWFVNNNYGGCNRDVGWFVVVTKNAGCAWERTERSSEPQILYCSGIEKCNWEKSGKKRVADAMLVSVQYFPETDPSKECILRESDEGTEDVDSKSSGGEGSLFWRGYLAGFITPLLLICCCCCFVGIVVLCAIGLNRLQDNPRVSHMQKVWQKMVNEGYDDEDEEPLNALASEDDRSASDEASDAKTE